MALSGQIKLRMAIGITRKPTTACVTEHCLRWQGEVQERQHMHSGLIAGRLPLKSADL